MSLPRKKNYPKHRRTKNEADAIKDDILSKNLTPKEIKRKWNLSSSNYWQYEFRANQGNRKPELLTTHG